MGVASSKSPLERRNTVARRSQRRTLHNQKTKIDQLLKDIRKFKGATEVDVDYVALKNEIIYLKTDLVRRSKDLQPEIRNLYENVYKKICDAEDALEYKLQENKKKQIKPNENVEIAQSVADGRVEVSSEAANDPADNRTIAEIHHDENKEINDLTNSEDKRRTVELKLVKVLAEASPKSAKAVRIVSPEEKRRSVLKIGVPVMLGVGMNELNAHTSRITRQYGYGRGTTTSLEGQAYGTVQEVQHKIDGIVENLRQIEFEINDEFIGKKNSRQYVRIRDTLNRILIELNSLSPLDEYIVEQISVCKNYVGSCLSFLNERAIIDDGSVTSDDEVWLNNNRMTKVEENFKMQKILKNTAV